MLWKQPIAFLLLFAFAAASFSRTVIVLDYYANTASFARNCVNKALPELKCNGKCQMMKKMREEEEKQRQNPETKAELKTEILSSKSYFPSILPIITISEREFGTYQARPFFETESADIFHPPRT